MCPSRVRGTISFVSFPETRRPLLPGQATAITLISTDSERGLDRQPSRRRPTPIRPGQSMLAKVRFSSFLDLEEFSCRVGGELEVPQPLSCFVGTKVSHASLHVKAL